jgi:hypothetical protein
MNEQNKSCQFFPGRDSQTKNPLVGGLDALAAWVELRWERDFTEGILR